MVKLCTKDYIGVYGRCRDCGDTVSHYNSNRELLKVRPQAKGSDWWVACDNPACDNHQGEEYLQSNPDWVKGKKP